MATGNFKSYVDQLSAIEYYKYDITVNYFDLRFKYRNINGNPNNTYTLEINGIVDFIETREYTILSQTKSATDAASWTVRLPEISNNRIPAFNTTPIYAGNSVAVSTASPYNISKLPEKQFIDRGLNYNVNEAGKNQYEGIISRYIGIYQNSDLQVENNGTVSITLSTNEGGPDFIVTNTAAAIHDYVTSNFYRYGQHPCLTVNLNPELAAEGQESEYFQIPIGVSRYKITLVNNQSGEKVITYLEGSLYNNPAYSPVQQINTQLPPPTASIGTLTLNSPETTQSTGVTQVTVPSVIGQGLEPDGADAVIRAAGLVPTRTYYKGSNLQIAYYGKSVKLQYPKPNTLVAVGSIIYYSNAKNPDGFPQPSAYER